MATAAREARIEIDPGRQLALFGVPDFLPTDPIVPSDTSAHSNSLRQVQTPGRYDRYRIGIHHVAFQAPSRELVDERLRWVRGQGAEIENDPKEYDYRPGYHAGFFYDPDGIKLEIVHSQ
jgi:catechol 2,3-dioxygenase-like lactoylglutathione lyase family enzyme